MKQKKTETTDIKIGQSRDIYQAVRNQGTFFKQIKKHKNLKNGL